MPVVRLGCGWGKQRKQKACFAEGFGRSAKVLQMFHTAEELQQVHLAAFGGIRGVFEPAVARAGDPAVWENVLKLNVLAPMHLMQLFAPPMQKARVSSQPEHMQHHH